MPSSAAYGIVRGAFMFPTSSPETTIMKVNVRRSKLKRKKKVGFRTRSKTAGGRKVIKRKRRVSKGKFRVG
jgi:large subunit ribosomal protein L34